MKLKSLAPKFTRNRLLAALMLVALAPLPAAAHITLDQAKAPAGSTYKAALRVGHGCDGSPTTGISVRLPVGFRGAHPVPKAGWALTVRRDKLAQPYDNHGRSVTEDVVEVSWKATSKDAYLLDAYYDEFVVRGQLPEQPGPLWFKVLQTCEKGSTDWAEIPATGASTEGLKAPAALLELVPAGHAGHHH